MSNHVYNSIPPSMPPRVVRLAWLAAFLLISATTLIGFAHRHVTTSAHDNDAVSSSMAKPPSADAPITLLPTVRVTPELEVTTLATIIVRPERGSDGSASRTNSGANELAADWNTSKQVVPASAAHSGGAALSMPYYSFSTRVRPANKE